MHPYYRGTAIGGEGSPTEVGQQAQRRKLADEAMPRVLRERPGSGGHSGTLASGRASAPTVGSGAPSYFPAQNWERRVCDLNRSICGKLQGRTDLN